MGKLKSCPRARAGSYLHRLLLYLWACREQTVQILGTPEETCWMAPEFLTSLVDLDEELSQALWQCGSSVDGGGNEMAFAEVARKFRWPDDFLKRADAWSAGKWPSTTTPLKEPVELFGV